MNTETFKVTILGSGSSSGIPVIGCTCDVCKSTDPHDDRTRPSILIELPFHKNILIDCNVDFREQFLREKIQNLNSVIITHCHADHVFGIDDLKEFTHGSPINMYADPLTWVELRSVFSYIFSQRFSEGGGIIQIKPIEVTSPFDICGTIAIPITVMHGNRTALGIRIGGMAYIPDVSKIEDYSNLENLDMLVIGGVGIKELHSHMNFYQALDEIEKIQPKRALLTHIHHHLKHVQIQELLDREIEKRKGLNGIIIQPAYDGFRFECTL